MRLKEMEEERNVICSGYLYAIRGNIIKKIPRDILADDAYISLMLNKEGYNTVYEPKSQVHVKYPTNLPDWIKQKKRTAAKFYQLNKLFKVSKQDSFIEELVIGFKSVFLVKNPKELFWFISLSIMMFYLWFRIFFDSRLWKRNYKKVWERVESTK